MAKDFSIPIKEGSPLGGFAPIYWTIENVRGCNLRCGFCATTKFPVGEYHYMSEAVFTDTMKIIRDVSPNARIEFANAGEPTLHPKLYKLLEIGRKYLPNAQLDVITNGTKLLSKDITHKGMFEAGASIVLVDVYGPVENHIRLAEESGYTWYERCKPHDDKLPKAWTNHHNSSIKCIILQPNPANWPPTKNRKNKMATMLNDVDFELAKEYGMTPVVNAPLRKCDQPSKSVNVGWDGEYTFCCFDFMRNSVKYNLGNVLSGTKGFVNFWMGEYMQTTRQILNRKNRPAHEFCSKCNFCSTRCDIAFWPEETLNQYVKDGKWYALESDVEVPKKGFFF